MLKTLYARLVLFLIRPALNRWAVERGLLSEKHARRLFSRIGRGW